ncbi:MAG TPA: hypothetical protein VJX71_03175, partial [Methylomirabilota bacterium]|nr:hypothetical protein [Methylomirabilota bacterium]
MSRGRVARGSLIVLSALVVTTMAGCRALPGSVPAGTSASSADAPRDAIEAEAIRRAMRVVADWQIAHPGPHGPDEWHGAPFWA